MSAADAARVPPPPVVVAVLALLLTAAPLAAVVPAGGEFQVNAYTGGVEDYAAVAVGAGGALVVVWETANDGDGRGVFARRFTGSTALGGELQVNSRTASDQRRPDVGLAADGRFVVAWGSDNQDGSSFGIFARIFDSAGGALTSELQVNTYTTLGQRAARVAVAPGGSFVIVWESDNDHDGFGLGVFGRRFDSAGAAQGSDFQVSVYTTSDQRDPAVAIADGGDFVAVWQSNSQDGDSWGVFGRRFSSSGAPQAAEFQVNVRTAGGQRKPAVAMRGTGDLVVAWQSYGQDGDGEGIFARRFSSAGSAVGGELQVNSHTTSAQQQPRVAGDAVGGFVVVWDSLSQDPSRGVFARHFGADGAPTGPELQVNVFTSSSQFRPDIDGDGSFVVAWTSLGQDGAGYGVFARLLSELATLDVDASGATEALTDGLLILRYLFGFDGAALITGAVDLQACGRCDAPAIEAYLDGLGPTLDVDASGAVGALTDGLLILRYLFGFGGTTLITGAVDLQECMHCEAAAIVAYLDGLST